jgi:predicted RNase H-like HicB family nuclease
MKRRRAAGTKVPPPRYASVPFAYVAEVPGAISQGETLDEARENLREAVELVLETNRRIALEHHEGRGRIQEILTVEPK